MLVKLCHFKKIVPLEEILKDLEALKKGFNRPASEEKLKSRELPAPPQPEIREKEIIPEKKAELTPPPPEDPPEEKKSPKLEDTQKEDTFAMKDPSVKYFMDTFKAQVISVDPIKKGKK